MENIPPEITSPESYYTNHALKNLVATDEVAPPPYVTMASFLVKGKVAGTYLITPTDFMEVEEARGLETDNLLIPNTTEEILAANKKVITGQDQIKSRYVAMTVALALFTRDYAHLPNALDQNTHRVNSVYLKKCYKLAYEAIIDGKLEMRTRLYVESTQRDMLP